MSLRELIGILMDSPLYWTLTVRGRRAYVNFMAETYAPKWC